MAKPISIPEDEILQYYRIKNLTTPPEAFELSDLDREMSNVLARVDLSKKEKAFQYYRALTKFRNLFQDFLIPKQLDDQQLFEKFDSEMIPSQPPLDEDNIQSSSQTDDEDPILREVKSIEKTLQPAPKKRKKITSGDEEEENDENGSDSNDENGSDSKDDITPLSRSGNKIQQDLSELNLKKKIAEITPKSISFSLKNRKVKISRNIWNAILNWFADGSFSDSPKFGKYQRSKPQVIAEIAQFIFKNKIIKLEKLENYPNLASFLESSGIRKSTTPAEFRPPSKIRLRPAVLSPDSKGQGKKSQNEKKIKVNFKAWNDNLF